MGRSSRGRQTPAPDSEGPKGSVSCPPHPPTTSRAPLRPSHTRRSGRAHGRRRRPGGPPPRQRPDDGLGRGRHHRQPGHVDLDVASASRRLSRARRSAPRTRGAPTPPPPRRCCGRRPRQRHPRRARCARHVLHPAATRSGPGTRARPGARLRSRRPVVAAPAVSSGSVWDRLAYCEAHGDWSTHTASGFSGGLQFADATWRSYGGRGLRPEGVAGQPRGPDRHRREGPRRCRLAGLAGLQHQARPAVDRTARPPLLRVERAGSLRRSRPPPFSVCAGIAWRPLGEPGDSQHPSPRT